MAALSVREFNQKIKLGEHAQSSQRNKDIAIDDNTGMTRIDKGFVKRLSAYETMVEMLHNYDSISHYPSLYLPYVAKSIAYGVKEGAIVGYNNTGIVLYTNKAFLNKYGLFNTRIPRSFWMYCIHRCIEGQCDSSVMHGMYNEALRLKGVLFEHMKHNNVSIKSKTKATLVFFQMFHIGLIRSMDDAKNELTLFDLTKVRGIPPSYTQALRLAKKRHDRKSI